MTEHDETRLLTGSGDDARLARILSRLDEHRRSGSHELLNWREGLTAEEIRDIQDACEFLEVLEQVGPPSTEYETLGGDLPYVMAHYRLERSIGSGGMGDVYKATDLALGRACAVKILPRTFSESLRQRLLHEARTAAQLQHPGIATFYETGEVEHQAFIAMEYVDGITLRGRLRNGPLPLNQALSCINGLLNALGHAHAMGILHRDIKPENIMLDVDDNAKLLDFGLAKSKIRERQNQVSETLITEPGAIVGTVGYMSPEQLRGQVLDERSDLFSVGAVMYEMLCQRPAFPGRNIAERMSAILATDPEPLSGSASISQVNMVLERAMAKDRDLRYANAAAFLDDLSLLASGELQSSWPNTLVVSDFENVSGNPADDWIGTGVADSISAELVGTDGVQVTPREKWARQMATDHGLDRRAGIDYHKLGLSLGCRWLVCGGYQRMGNALRFTIYLKQLLTDTNVITAKLDGTVDGIFSLQDRLAALIRTYYTDQKPQSEQLPKPEPAPPRPQPSAYEFYVKGRQQWQRSGKADFSLAQSLFEKAIQRDPEYALAYAGLATVHALRFTYTTDSSFIDTAKLYAEKALALDSKLSEARVWLGYAYLNDLDTKKAFAQQLMALQIDRDNLYGNYFAGVCLNASHSQSEATSLVCQMLVQDHVRNAHEWRFAQAVQFFQAALRVAPEHGWSYLGASTAQLALGRFTESQACLERAMELDPRFSVPGVEGFLAETYRRVGRYDDAREKALHGIDAVDASDSMYRDTLRAIYLCCLGRAAMADDNCTSAAVAFNQAVQHLEGRNRARGGGHTLVQALAGLAQSRNDETLFERALAIYRQPSRWSFHYLPLCSADITLCSLATCAAKFRKIPLASQLKMEAIDYGSLEAQQIRVR